MSTTVTVAVAAPNHLPVNVTVQTIQFTDRKPVWVDAPAESKSLKVGEAATFMVYGSRRITVEEVASS
jgi:hypothetical protein